MLIRPFFLFLVLLFTSNSVFAATGFIINGVHQADDSVLPGEDRKVINDAAEDGWSWYEDRALGFRLMIPSDSVIDASLAPVVTRFTTADATIQVFFDDFKIIENVLFRIEKGNSTEEKPVLIAIGPDIGGFVIELAEKIGIFGAVCRFAAAPVGAILIIV